MKTLIEYLYIDITGPIYLLIIGLYFAWDSYRNSKTIKLVLAYIAVAVGGIASCNSIISSINNDNRVIKVDNTLNEHQSKLDEILTHDQIIKLGNKAFAGDRNSLLKLKTITTSFGDKRDAAIVELFKVFKHYSSASSLNGVRIEKYDSNNKLIDEKKISTEILVEILLFNSQHLFRARSAQLLANRNETYVYEALLLSIFTDDNLVVMQNSIKAFENLTGHQNRIVLDPYDCLSFWYDNMTRINSSVDKKNDVSLLQLDKFMARMFNKAQLNQKEEMLNWYATGYEMSEVIKEKKKIEPNNRR